MNKIWILIVATIMALGVLELRAQPVDPPPPPGGVGEHDESPRRFSPRWNRMPAGEISDQEWAEVQTFLRDHSPYRLELLQRVPENTRTYHRLRGMIVNRYRHLERVRQQDTRAYELMLAQFALEDEALRLASELRSAPPSEQERIRDELRQIAVELVQSSIQERKRRLEELERAIQEERARLQADQQDVQALVESRLEQLINWGLEGEHSGAGRPPGLGRMEGDQRPDGPRRSDPDRRPPGERQPRRP